MLTNAFSVSTNQRAELDNSSEFKFTNAQQVAFLVYFRQQKLNSIGINHHDP